MLWLALHCPPPASARNDVAPPPDGGLRGELPVAQGVAAHADDFWPTLACWAGRYTPHVNLAADALRLDIGASLRLFGGLEALLGQLRAELAAMRVAAQLAVAPTPLAALWLARAGDGTVCADHEALRAALSALPLSALQLPPPLARRIEGFGLRCLGAVLALPRASLGRRLGKDFVLDLARALGELADPQPCFVFPERFEQEVELPAPVESAPVLLFAARRLIAALTGWLAVRNGALRSIELRLGHAQGACTVVPLAFSQPMHAAPRIERVLKERLDALRLPASVLSLRLCAGASEPRSGGSQMLFEGAGQGQEMLAELLDRLTARLGAEAVRGLACHADHRPERASRMPAQISAAGAPETDSLPRPLWLLESPEALREVRGRPRRGSELRLLGGPERIESGWWDGVDARRDYFVAIDGRGTWLWIFRDSGGPGGWFLHGLFS
ncbi:MAG: DNA polymerase Y family protein [Rhodocyclales bacterium]|nr:DNA polymerase Y family protein [Rhodocyclales bacterium]